jgi:thiosulfate reductase cytochrome b subunit
MTELAADDAAVPLVQETRERLIYRHTLWVRSWHWINAISLLILLMSGLQIFNADPQLSWGKATSFDHPLLSMQSVGDGSQMRGTTTVLGRTFDTTGVLGASKGADGQREDRGFPNWATIPGARDLGTGRHWHFLFAWIFVVNGVLFVGYTLQSRHLKRDLWPTADDLKTIPASIWEHVRLKHPEGDAAARYNVLQKLAYLIVLYGLLPLMLLTGLTMSPGMDAAFPGLLWVFGGRQSARTLHFLSASGIVIFFLIHIFEVFVAGAANELRSIVTGYFAVKTHAPAPTRLPSSGSPHDLSDGAGQ